VDQHAARLIMLRLIAIFCKNSSKMLALRAVSRHTSPSVCANLVFGSDRARHGRTSPTVGVARETQLGFQGVYRLDPDGSLTLVADDFVQPNGLCFMPGEQILLINDTGKEHIRGFKLNADGSLSGGEVLAIVTGQGPGKPDGMKVDVEGRIYCNGPGGVHVLTPEGKTLGVIRTPEQSRNFCFGGRDYSELFIAASSKILRVRTKTRGLPAFS
jgi:gluconolactonase